METFEEMKRIFAERYGVIGPTTLGEFPAELFHTAEGARKLCEALRQNVEAVFYATGSIDLTSFIYASFPSSHACVMSLMGPDYSHERKFRFSEMVKHLAEGVKAVCVATVSETWAVQGTDRDELDAWQKKNGYSLEHHPQRTEQLWMQFDCARFAAHFTCPITEVADPVMGGTVRRLGAWAEFPRVKSWSGNLVGMRKPFDRAES